MFLYKGNVKYLDKKLTGMAELRTLLGALRLRLDFDGKTGKSFYIFGIRTGNKEKNNPGIYVKENEADPDIKQESGHDGRKPSAFSFSDLLKCKELFVDILQRLVRHLFPKVISGYLYFGFEDPSYTGRVLAVLSSLHVLSKGKFEVTPVWDNSIIECDVSVSGRFHLFYLTYLAFRVWFNKDFQTIRRQNNG